MSSNTMLYALYRMGYHGRATTHGFRAVASTILNESNLFNRDWIERQLAHVERNEVRRAYNAAEWMPDRRRMMQWWADHITAMALEGNKIVPLQRARLDQSYIDPIEAATTVSRAHWQLGVRYPVRKWRAIQNKTANSYVIEIAI